MEAKPRIPKCFQRGETQGPPCLLILSLALMAGALQAQLAITEVMSNAATNLGPNVVNEKSDFWELTNFGTNLISLHGYSFNDRDTNASTRVNEPFTNCFIAPGESIIFMRRDGITTRDEFMEWWGTKNLRPDLQVRTYPKKPGFDPTVDAVQLFDPDGNLVDRVEFGLSLQGHTFGCDPETGEFGHISTMGTGGTFKAVLADDYGSPGVTGGAIPLSILQQPETVTQDAGLDAEFFVRAAGLPRPHFQWFFNGLALPNQRQPRLTLPNVQPKAGGQYTVRISNGVATVLSAPATLIVNTTPLGARIVEPPADITVFTGQTAVFMVRARGFPIPTFQWQRNGIDIPGATSNRLEVADVSLALDGSIYTVVVRNGGGSASASAQLRVTERPHLAVTEVMAAAVGGNDWFELTNLDTFPVDLLGYRVSDTYAFDSAFRITNSVTIHPGESIIFVERLSPAEFKQWWGEERVWPGLQVITYYGLGLSRSGDLVLIWNAAERDVYEPIARSAFLESPAGSSLEFYPPDFFFPEVSLAGLNGAFPSASGNGSDVGSPGFMTNPPPRFLSMEQTEKGVAAKCRVINGRLYDLRFKTLFSDSSWVTIETYTANDWVIRIPIPVDSLAGQRFFRLEEWQ